jgi:hypothetical protein
MLRPHSTRLNLQFTRKLHVKLYYISVSGCCEHILKQKIALQPSKIFDPQGFEPIDPEVFICASSK